jgi:hypothetical protein
MCMCVAADERVREMYVCCGGRAGCMCVAADERVGEMQVPRVRDS